MVRPTRVTNEVRRLRFANEMAFQIARVFGVPLDEVFGFLDSEATTS
jgi:DNA-binding XRE family transcriptional regulator